MAKNKPETVSASSRIRAATSAVNLPQPESIIPPERRKEPELWQVVVAGAIDPRQHHPFWYRSVDIISEEEAKFASQTTLIVTIPQATDNTSMPSIVQFDVGPFALICSPDKWTVQTVTAQNANRLIAVATTVFAKLYEIPVSAFGVNRVFSVTLSRMEAKKFLSDKLANADLALPKGDSDCHIAYTNHLVGSETSIHVSPSPVDHKALRILYNRHHPAPKKATHFDLGELLREHAEMDWKSAAQYGVDLADCITRAEKI